MDGARKIVRAMPLWFRCQERGKLKNLIEYLVKELVDDPDQVNISEVPGDEATTYEVRVAPDDLGKVIGKQGRIANALPHGSTRPAR